MKRKYEPGDEVICTASGVYNFPEVPAGTPGVIIGREDVSEDENVYLIRWYRPQGAKDFGTHSDWFKLDEAYTKFKILEKIYDER